MTTKQLDNYQMRLTDVEVDEVKEYDEIDNHYSTMKAGRTALLDEDPETDIDGKYPLIGNLLFMIPVITPIVLYYKAWSDDEAENVFTKKSMLKLLDLQVSYGLIVLLIGALAPSAFVYLAGAYVLISLYSAFEAWLGNVWNPPYTIGSFI